MNFKQIKFFDININHKQNNNRSKVYNIIYLIIIFQNPNYSSR